MSSAGGLVSKSRFFFFLTTIIGACVGSAVRVGLSKPMVVVGPSPSSSFSMDFCAWILSWDACRTASWDRSASSTISWISSKSSLRSCWGREATFLRHVLKDSEASLVISKPVVFRPAVVDLSVDEISRTVLGSTPHSKAISPQRVRAAATYNSTPFRQCSWDCF